MKNLNDLLNSSLNAIEQENKQCMTGKHTKVFIGSGERVRLFKEVVEHVSYYLDEDFKEVVSDSRKDELFLVRQISILTGIILIKNIRLDEMGAILNRKESVTLQIRDRIINIMSVDKNEKELVKSICINVSMNMGELKSVTEINELFEAENIWHEIFKTRKK